MADNSVSLEVANLALMRMGEKLLTTSLTEQPAIAASYETSVQEALVFAPWTFARTRLNLEQLPTAPLSTRYSFQYRLPNSPQFLRAIEINDQPEQFVDHALEVLVNNAVTPITETRVILCSLSPPVTLRFVYRSAESTWTPPFKTIAALYLALAVNESIGPKTSIKQAILLELEDRRDRLATVDAHQGSPPQAQQNNLYLHARLRRSTPLGNQLVTPPPT